jgi:hypothetical protein
VDPEHLVLPPRQPRISDVRVDLVDERAQAQRLISERVERATTTLPF